MFWAYTLAEDNVRSWLGCGGWAVSAWWCLHSGEPAWSQVSGRNGGWGGEEIAHFLWKWCSDLSVHGDIYSLKLFALEVGISTISLVIWVFVYIKGSLRKRVQKTRDVCFSRWVFYYFSAVSCVSQAPPNCDHPTQLACSNWHCVVLNTLPPGGLGILAASQLLECCYAAWMSKVWLPIGMKLSSQCDSQCSWPGLLTCTCHLFGFWVNVQWSPSLFLIALKCLSLQRYLYFSV